MKLAIAGGTGWVGKFVVQVAREAGHTETVISRSGGTDLVSGVGLVDALSGVEAVIDVTNSTRTRRSQSIAFFETATRNLLAAERMTGVDHHVALSIAGVDRVPLGYYQGKLRQEALIAENDVPRPGVPAGQIHAVPLHPVARVKGPIVPVPRMRSSPVAAREVAARLVALATGAPIGFAPEFGGPEIREMPDLTRLLVRVTGARRWVVPVRLPGEAGDQMADGGLVAIGDGPRGHQTFDQWLARHAHA